VLGGPLEDERARPAGQAALEHAHGLDADERLIPAPAGSVLTSRLPGIGSSMTTGA
jgi:hypothetical protein